MRSVLAAGFYDRPVQAVARDLLGKALVRRFPDDTVVESIITETEAYDGPRDKACHAYGPAASTRSGRARSPHMRRAGRAEPMFGPPGYMYVYMCYGMHWMLNIVTGEKGYPAAVLVRGTDAVSGPGRLTKALSIDGSFNRLPARRSTGLWIEDRGARIPPRSIRTTPRIGVAYAGAWAKKPWRYVLADDHPYSASERGCGTGKRLPAGRQGS